jgi:hypothetical protein
LVGATAVLGTSRTEENVNGGRASPQPRCSHSDDDQETRTQTQLVQQKLLQGGVTIVRVLFVAASANVVPLLQQAVDGDKVGVLVHCGYSSAIDFDLWVQQHYCLD